MEASQMSFGEFIDGVFSLTVDRLSDALNLDPVWFQWVWIGMFICGLFLVLEQHQGNTVSMVDNWGRFSLLKNTAYAVLLGPGFFICGFVLSPPWLVFKLSVEIYDELWGSKDE